MLVAGGVGPAGQRLPRPLHPEQQPCQRSPLAVLEDQRSVSGQCTELIFVTNITNYIRGEKIAMWRNFSFLY